MPYLLPSEKVSMGCESVFHNMFIKLTVMHNLDYPICHAAIPLWNAQFYGFLISFTCCNPACVLAAAPGMAGKVNDEVYHYHLKTVFTIDFSHKNYYEQKSTLLCYQMSILQYCQDKCHYFLFRWTSLETHTKSFSVWLLSWTNISEYIFLLEYTLKYFIVCFHKVHREMAL